MAEGAEVEDGVDINEDNYMEDVDEDIEEQLDDNREDHGEFSGKDQSPEMESIHATTKRAEDEEERTASSLNGDDKDKQAGLLSLPPHESKVFIGGLPQDVFEEDLRDLREPFGEVFEVEKIQASFLCWQGLSILAFDHLSFPCMDIQVRLIQDKGIGKNKGYAFLAFRTQEEAQAAIEELHSKEFKVILELPFSIFILMLSILFFTIILGSSLQDKTLRCSLPESKEDEFRKAIEEVGLGIETIKLIKVGF